MAEEKDISNIEEQEEKSSRKKLIFSIILFILVMILLIMGIVLFVIIQNNNEGQISIEGSNVHIQATARIEGGTNTTSLTPIYINSEDETPVYASWDDISLFFDNEDSIISIYITIINYNDVNGLAITYDNATQINNLHIENSYYINQGQEIDIVNQSEIIVSAGDRITFIARFSVIDVLQSFENRLDITINCRNYEE